MLPRDIHQPIRCIIYKTKDQRGKFVNFLEFNINCFNKDVLNFAQNGDSRPSHSLIACDLLSKWKIVALPMAEQTRKPKEEA